MELEAGKKDGAAAAASSAAADDGYLEKLVAQIVRNIQVTITDVHVRLG